MSVLTGTYGLTLGTTVEANVIAINDYGQSTVSSDSSTAATIQTAPVKMTSLAKGSSTTES